MEVQRLQQGGLQAFVAHNVHQQRADLGPQGGDAGDLEVPFARAGLNEIAKQTRDVYPCLNALHGFK
ncbi:MAG: hypothetical protein ACOVQL_04990 [Limnohabitans sp.]